MEQGRARKEYRPQWAPHVVGTYDVRAYDPETGAPEEQRVDMYCESCCEAHRVVCRTGHVREHVASFARLHQHRDPLA
jgi:hypothetical protein